MYSKELVETLLMAANFACSPRDLGSNQLPFDVYYYPHQMMNREILWQDLRDCVVSQGKKIRDRRVIFLIKAEEGKYAAAIVHLSQVDENARKTCERLFEQPTDEPLTESQRLALSGLYRNIRCWLLGNGHEKEATLLWRSYFQMVYPKATCQIEVQPIGDEAYAGMVFAECMLRLAQQQSIGTLDAQQMLIQHHRLLQGLLARWWTDIQQNQPAVFTELAALTRRLLKYAALQTLRQSHATGMLTASYDQLNALLAQDKTQKARLYAAPLTDIFPLLKQLSFPTIAGLIVYRQPANLPGLIGLLQGECEKQKKHIQQWETDLSKMLSERRWVNRQEMAYFVAQQVYQYSLIGLGAELTPILALLGLKAVGLSETFTPTQQKQLLSGLKYVGGGIGAYFTTVSGSYWLAKSFFIGNASHWLNNFLQTARLDDHTATVRSPFPLGKIGLSRSLYLSIAALESFAYGRSHYFTRALGGILGSIGSVALGTRWFAEAALPEQSADIAALTFLCSIAGYEIGQLVAGTFHQGADKLATRETLSQVFCEMVEKNDYRGCATDFSMTSVWSPSFWINSQDTVRLNWHEPKGFQETTCDIVPLTGGEHGVVCDWPVTLAVKQLG